MLARLVAEFLLIVSPEAARADAQERFRAGLAAARRIHGRSPTAVHETAGACVAAFPRANGSSASIALDAESGAWLLAAGTWFHTEGFGSGAEGRLLARARTIGPEKLADELEGFFVLAFGDARAREVVVLTDVIGSHHCFTRALGPSTAIAASSLLLAALGDVSLDPTACEEFLSTGVIYEERTLFREVRKVGPATILRFRVGELADRRKYWSLVAIDPVALDGERAVTALSESLVAAASRVGRLFPRPVCDLTGGYDSRLMVSAFAKAGVPFETTVTGPADDPDVADVVVAAALARELGVRHWPIAVDGAATFERLTKSLRLTDGECDVVDYSNILFVHENSSRRGDATINGSFGEVARGYWWELLAPGVGVRRLLDARKVAAARYAVDRRSPLLSIVPGFDVTAHLAGAMERANADLRDAPDTMQMDHAYLSLRMQRWQGRIASATDRIWPCLSPMMFRSVLETMVRVRPGLRRHSRLVRRVLVALHPRLAAQPLEHGYPALPLTITNWPRFAPWLAEIGRRAARKAARKLGFERLLAPARSSSGSSTRERLLADERIGELLRPERMALCGVIDAGRLRSFLDAARQPGFAHERQWNRLLGLELALRMRPSDGAASAVTS